MWALSFSAQHQLRQLWLLQAIPGVLHKSQLPCNMTIISWKCSVPFSCFSSFSFCVIESQQFRMMESVVHKTSQSCSCARWQIVSWSSRSCVSLSGTLGCTNTAYLRINFPAILLTTLSLTSNNFCMSTSVFATRLIGRSISGVALALPLPLTCPCPRPCLHIWPLAIQSGWLA